MLLLSRYNHVRSLIPILVNPMVFQQGFRVVSQIWSQKLLLLSWYNQQKILDINLIPDPLRQLLQWQSLFLLRLARLVWPTLRSVSLFGNTQPSTTLGRTPKLSCGSPFVTATGYLSNLRSRSGPSCLKAFAPIKDMRSSPAPPLASSHGLRSAVAAQPLRAPQLWWMSASAAGVPEGNPLPAPWFILLPAARP